MINTNTVPVVHVVFEKAPAPGITDAIISPIRGVWISGWMLVSRDDGGFNVGAIDEELEIPDPSQRLEFETWLREQHTRWLDGRAPVALEYDEAPHVTDTRFVPTSSTEYVVETDLSNGMTVRLFYFTEPESLDEFALESPVRVTFENDHVRTQLQGEVYRAYAATWEGDDSSESAVSDDDETDQPSPPIASEWQRRVSEALAGIDLAGVDDIVSAGRQCHDELEAGRAELDDEPVSLPI